MDKIPKLMGAIGTEFLMFVKWKFSHKKTFDITVKNRDFEVLGRIYYHNHWRRYIFEPKAEKIFDSKCLKDITKYIDDLMEDRKK